MSDFRAELEKLLPEVIIHSVTFDHADGVLEIAYAELRDQTEGVGLAKSIALERQLFLSEIDELEDILRHLIDEGFLAIRNEDARKARVERALERTKRHRDEDEDE